MKITVVEPNSKDEIKVKCPICRRIIFHISDTEDRNELCRHCAFVLGQDIGLECAESMAPEILTKAVGAALLKARNEVRIVPEEDLYGIFTDLDILKSLEMEGVSEILVLATGGGAIPFDNLFWGITNAKKRKKTKSEARPARVSDSRIERPRRPQNPSL